MLNETRLSDAEGGIKTSPPVRRGCTAQILMEKIDLVTTMCFPSVDSGPGRPGRAYFVTLDFQFDIGAQAFEHASEIVFDEYVGLVRRARVIRRSRIVFRLQLDRFGVKPAP